MVELYWSESDIAWNGYIDFSVVCLHWVEMNSDKDQREFSLSLQYNSTLTELCRRVRTEQRRTNTDSQWFVYLSRCRAV